MKLSLILFFLVLCNLVNANSIRTLVVYSEGFLKSYSSSSIGREVTIKEIAKLNNSLKSQGAKVYFDVVGNEVVAIENPASPYDLCLGFTGDSHWEIPANPKFGRLNEFREKYQADVIFLMTVFDNNYFREDKNYGIACDPLHDGTLKPYVERDPSYLIIDKLGLDTLTLPHEAGHFLGLDHHYVRLESGLATMMIGNGNIQNLQRVNLWSEERHKVFEIDGVISYPSHGLSDIEFINSNSLSASQAFERWASRSKN